VTDPVAPDRFSLSGGGVRRRLVPAAAPPLLPGAAASLAFIFPRGERDRRLPDGLAAGDCKEGHGVLLRAQLEQTDTEKCHVIELTASCDNISLHRGFITALNDEARELIYPVDQWMALP